MVPSPLHWVQAGFCPLPLQVLQTWMALPLQAWQLRRAAPLQTRQMTSPVALQVWQKEPIAVYFPEVELVDFLVG
jgi:hypothetical protein